MNPRAAVARLGARTIEGVREASYLAAVSLRVLEGLVRPGLWPYPTRNVAVRQIFFTGVGAMRFTLLLALLVGVSIVLQAKLWLREVGQGELLGPVLVAIVVRELAPLLVNVAILVRSGSAIVTELASMRVAGEIRLLDAQGLDPLRYLVMPRVLGLTVSVLCLTIVFNAAALGSGYVAAIALEENPLLSLAFFSDVLGALELWDLPYVALKAGLPAFLVALVACTEGLSAQGSLTAVPQAATRALSRAGWFLFVTSGALSIVRYL